MSEGPSADGPRGDDGAADAEDLKLVSLARATRARTGAAEGAAVRDSTGRAYAAATVSLRTLRLSAVQAAVAAAVASGGAALEAAAVVSARQPPEEPALAELGCSVLLIADLEGTITGVRRNRSSGGKGGR